MNTQLIATKIKKIEEVDSTNTALKTLSQQGDLPEGFCLTTDYQTSGRGQYGKQWDAEKGKNLLMSVFLRPDFLPAGESYRLTMSVCLALLDLGRHFGAETQIKWPNDWLIGGKKLAGVLAESTLKGSKMENCIVGIGINVERQNFKHPQAVSMEDAMRTKLDRDVVFKVLVEELNQRYLDLKHGLGDLQHREFNQSLYGRNEFVDVMQAGEKKKLRCLRVEVNGALKVEWENGAIETLQHQAISFLL